MNPEKVPSYPPHSFQPPKPSLPTRQSFRKWAWGTLTVIAILGIWGALLLFSKPKIIIATNVTGAQVFVDGVSAGTTAQNSQLAVPRVSTGRRVIRIVHPDYLPAEREIQVKFSFEPATFNFKLNPAAHPLSIKTNPTLSKVLIDGQVVGESDFVSGSLDIPLVKRGPHTVLIQHPGFDDYSTQFVMPDGPHTLNIQMLTTVNGFWSGSWRETEKGKAAESIYNFSLDLKQSGTTVSGTWEELPAQLGKGASTPKQPKSFPVTGTIIGKQLILEKKPEKGKPVKFEARVADTGREFTGNFTTEKSTGTWFAARMESKPVLNPPLTASPTTPIIGGPAFPGPKLPSLPGPSGTGFPPVDGTTQPVGDPLAQARELYEQRQYQAALRICEGVLKADPKNQAAKELRNRIKKTIDILNRQNAEANGTTEPAKPKNP